jgi:hypothetical protein
LVALVDIIMMVAAIYVLAAIRLVPHVLDPLLQIAQLAVPTITKMQLQHV